MPTRELLLVRHCASTGQPPESRLSDEGYRQAQTLADFLDGHAIGAVVSSPFRRARETIEPFARRRGLELRTDPRLAEHTLSAESRDDWRDCVRRCFEDPDYRAPGGESARESRARAWAAIDTALDAGPALPVLVSHGQLLSLLLSSVDPDFGYAGWASMRNPDVFRLAVEAGKGRAFERILP